MMIAYVYVKNDVRRLYDDNNKYVAILWKQRAAQHCEFFNFEEN